MQFQPIVERRYQWQRRVHRRSWLHSIGHNLLVILICILFASGKFPFPHFHDHLLFTSCVRVRVLVRARVFVRACILMDHLFIICRSFLRGCY